MARQFVGSSSEYYEFADNAAIKSGSGAFSIFLRVYFDSLGASEDRIISKGNASGGSFGGVRYEVVAKSTQMFFAIDDNSTKSQCSWNTTITTGSWLDIIAIRDTTNVMLYEAGTQRATASDGTGDVDTTSTLVVGAGREAGDTITAFCDARIAEVAYIGRAASAGEIASFAAGASAKTFKPDAYFEFTRNIRELCVPVGLSATGGTPVEVVNPPIRFNQVSPVIAVPGVVAAGAGRSNPFNGPFDGPFSGAIS